MTKPRRISPCIHFNGIQHGACKAGVNYRALTGGGEGCALRLPCVTFSPGERIVEKVKCAQQRPETEVEAAARETETDARIKVMLGANKEVEAFEDANGGRQLGKRRQMECPACKKVLMFYRGASRLYVECETPKCIKYEGNYGSHL